LIRRAGLSQDARLMKRLLFLSLLASTALADSLDSHVCEHCAKHLLPQPLKLVAGRKYARDRRVDIEHVKLDVTPDFTKRTVAGTMTMTFRPIALPLEKLELDAVGLTLAKIDVTGAQLADQIVSEEKLTLVFAKPIAPDAEVSVSIRYSVEPRHGLYFRTPEMGYKPGDTQLWTQGEADLHRFWFPCYDYPNERFTSEIICHVPADMEVVSNGALVSKQPAGALTAWHWKQDKPHVNYLIALAAGYFQKLEDKVGELPLAMLVPPSQKHMAELAFQDTRKIIEFYNRETGVPFAWDKYFQVYCHDFLAGGMENTSCTFEASDMLFDTSVENLRSLRWLDAHETAHQWFGDLVTCRDWSHLWLNEGFASYYTILYEQEKLGLDAMKLSLWEEAESVFGANDARPTVWRDYQDPMQQFDTRVYPKGAWILHMLRSQLGADLYRKAIRTYLERHRNGIVGTDDLHDVIEEVSGLSFDQFFDQWLYHGGFPELKIDYAWDTATKQAKISVRQTQKLTEQVRLFRVPLPVAFTIKGQKEPLRFTMDVHEAAGDFYFALPAQPTLARIDPDYTVLAKIDFTPPGPMLDEQLTSDVIGQLLAVRQLGKRDDQVSIDKLTKLVRADAFHAVQEESAKALSKIAAPAARAALISLLADQKDARVRLAVVQGLASIPHPDCQKALQAHASQEKNPLILAAIVKSWGMRPGDAAISAELVKALTSTSFNNAVATAAIQALRAQDDASAVPAVLKRLRETPLDFRTRDYAAALESLAFLARQREAQPASDDVRTFLVQQLTNPREALRTAAAKSLGALRDPRSLAVLEPLAAPSVSPFHDPVREAAAKSVQTLQATLTSPAELKNLWDQIQQLQKKTETLEKQMDDAKKKAAPQKK
jgi:aminopeptidase N